MSLLRNFSNKKSAEFIRNLADIVLSLMLGNALFNSLLAELEILETLNDTLRKDILARPMRNRTTNVDMKASKAAVVAQLEVVRKAANPICDNDPVKEMQTGFTPSKTGRTTRTSIAPAVVKEVNTTKVRGQLEIVLEETVEDNRGYEVHYILDGKDYIAGVGNVKSRTLKMLVGGFPSLKEIEVYLITLGTHSLRSTPSNPVSGVAM